MSHADHEIWMRCQNIRLEAERRKFACIGPEAAFRAAADALELSTRYAAKAVAKAEGQKTSRISSGDISASGVVVMDAILDFADAPFNVALLARYCDRDEKWVSAAIRKLRSAGLLARDSCAVCWERFDLDYYNEALEARVYKYGSSVPADTGLSRWMPRDTWIVLLRIAAFGRPELLPLNLMLICGEGHDTWEALNWLRWAGLVKDEAFEVDIGGLDRFERYMGA